MALQAHSAAHLICTIPRVRALVRALDVTYHDGTRLSRMPRHLMGGAKRVLTRTAAPSRCITPAPCDHKLQLRCPECRLGPSHGLSRATPESCSQPKRASFHYAVQGESFNSVQLGRAALVLYLLLRVYHADDMAHFSLQWGWADHDRSNEKVSSVLGGCSTCNHKFYRDASFCAGRC